MLPRSGDLYWVVSGPRDLDEEIKEIKGRRFADAARWLRSYRLLAEITLQQIY